MDRKQPSMESLRHLILGQPRAVLAAVREGEPCTSLVAFAATENLDSILFPTGLKTRKAENMRLKPLVSLLIDDQTNRPMDFETAEAVTVPGRATFLGKSERADMKKILLAKHAALESFVESSG